MKVMHMPRSKPKATRPSRASAKTLGKISAKISVKSPAPTKRPVLSDFTGLKPIVAPWPKGKRCACLLTFALDAEVAWIHRGSDDPIALSMGRYESKVGVPLLLNMLDDYGIKSTFFVPGWVAERYTATVEDILRRGHDIEHHGY